MSVKDKQKSKSFDSVEDIHTKSTEDISPTQKDPILEEKGSKQPRTDEKTVPKKRVRVATRTYAGVNWATIVNKITLPNAVKVGMTVGAGYVGSVVGAGLLTGVGFAIGGPAGASIGYGSGTLLFGGAGLVGGNKFGRFIANKIEDAPRESAVEVGYTEVGVSTDEEMDEE